MVTQTEQLAVGTQRVRFSIGFNHDPELVAGLIELNLKYASRACIDEVFGALPDAPLPSARPTSLLRETSWDEFVDLVARLRRAGISYNFLLNTAAKLDENRRRLLREYLVRLHDCGVQRLTVGTPELCAYVKEHFPNFHVTISVTFGIQDESRLADAKAASPDAVYLQPVTVNRDFPLLRALVRLAHCECRLYANVSCLSACPAVQQHYQLFVSQKNPEKVNRLNDLFFAGCSLVKLRNPVEWIQMPWIRPEDVGTYVTEGIGQFKLADRLAPTPILLVIAESYLSGKSPPDLFGLMERDGRKFRRFQPQRYDRDERDPFRVHSTDIPEGFIEHFRQGNCKSQDPSCPTCRAVAHRAVNSNWAEIDDSALDRFRTEIPPGLAHRLR